MQRKEFENRIKNLLPKAADDVVESWAAYATELDHYGTEVTADFYDKNYIAMLLVKQRHWDVDELEDLELLPTEIDIPDDMTDMEEISDYITDQTGFCHNGFIVED